MTEITRGFYRHYKGGTYYVIGIAENHDGGPDIVIYESLQGVNKTPQRMCWRTVEEFTEEVVVEHLDFPPISLLDAVSRTAPRFVRIDEP